MCGIGGIYNLNKQPVNMDLLLKMTRIIKHRGPDDEGFLSINTHSGIIDSLFHDDTIYPIKSKTKYLNKVVPGNLSFGFRRLAVLDLTESGHQPMSNEDKSIWIVFNGEVFNYIELREDLKKLGYRFKSKSDTEVVIRAYEQWGEECLNYFNGMWAFALWDNNKKKLFCARDRFGIKPFYYYWEKKQFVFGSEIKQLLVHNIPRNLNERMVFKSIKLNSFLIYGDETYFDNIHILPHSHYLTIENGTLSINRYYDLYPSSFETANLSFNDAVDSYSKLFEDAVKIRMRSDVEVGSCLSGGLDSSAIVTTAAKHNNDKPFKTFSAFNDEGLLYDERKWINIVNGFIGAQPHLVEPNPQDFQNDFG